MIACPDFMEPDEWVAMVALFQFMQFDTMRTELAMVWIGEGVLKASPDRLETSKLVVGEDRVLCIRFTTFGRKMTREFMRKFGVNPAALKTLKDPYLDDTVEAGVTFLMHDRRYGREFLEGDFDRLEKFHNTKISYETAAEIYKLRGFFPT